ncbi:hypothetical protein ABW19_dt0209221 [Dactylella cylindrospora]|nr:hypothetical protein ABW19_dt0209221 [Dactylella cylindrospora]
MCRYRQYHFSCGHVKVESPPYLPCNPEEFCSPDDPDLDKPINLKKNTACGDASCSASEGMPMAQPNDGGTSWSRTNSMNRGSGLGEEGDPGARLRHTVSTKMKVSGIAKIARSMTKKHKEQKQKDNGVDGFLPDNTGRYHEIGNEMDDLKK